MRFYVFRVSEIVACVCVRCCTVQERTFMIIVFTLNWNAAAIDLCGFVLGVMLYKRAIYVLSYMRMRIGYLDVFVFVENYRASKWICGNCVHTRNMPFHSLTRSDKIDAMMRRTCVHISDVRMYSNRTIKTDEMEIVEIMDANTFQQCKTQMQLLKFHFIDIHCSHIHIHP